MIPMHIRMYVCVFELIILGRENVTSIRKNQGTFDKSRTSQPGLIRALE